MPNYNNTTAAQTKKEECGNINESYTLGSLTNLLRGAYITFDEAIPPPCVTASALALYLLAALILGDQGHGQDIR